MSMRKKPGKVGENKSQVVRDIPMACADERAAVELIERLRWGDNPTCPDCESANVYALKSSKTGERNKDWRWRCRDCRRLYTVRMGTVMEDSRIPYRHWAYAMWRATTSKKGVAAKEIQRQTGLSYKSSLFLMHRIRWAMQDSAGDGKFNGFVEADETYVGGKPRVKGNRKKPLNKPGWGTKKQPVMAIVQRRGSVVTRVIPRVTSRNLMGMIYEKVELDAAIMTDGLPAYKGLNRYYRAGHHVVNHKGGEYVRGDVHTNTVEGFFSILKRGLNGIWHAVSRQHLHRYLAAAEFRYNHRELNDGERVTALVQASVGKRLRYRDAVAKPQRGVRSGLYRRAHR